MGERKHQPLWKDFIAGGVAGTVEISIMYPLDVVKTRNQLATSKSTGIVQTLGLVVKDQGPLGLYRGILSPLLAEAPKRAWKFSSNEFFKKLVATKEGKVTNIGAAVSGALVGITETAVNCPFEVVKVRMQAKDNVGRYKNTMDCAKQLFKAEGLAGLFRGAEPQCWRSGTWNMVYFGLIGSVRNYYPPPPNAPRTQNMATQVLTGSIAGGVATTFATPFDVVKSRFQNQLPGQVRRYNWAVPSLIDIYRTEGFRACYKGYAARMARLVPGGGIMLAAFEYFSELLAPF